MPSVGHPPPCPFAHTTTGQLVHQCRQPSNGRTGSTQHRLMMPSHPPPATRGPADMRKALPRDAKKESVIPLPHPITPDELEW
jgi:hypothetical protein